LELFTTKLLPGYEEQRNKPEADGTSCLSPWLHYGHIGPQTIALAVDAAAKKDPALKAARDSYFNELIAWRELTINFVKFQPNYDSAECADAWAKKTIAEHAKDERDRVYTLEQMESAGTYDELWNAAQTQMVRHGWMHNYMRMYWAKKILEWTPDAPTAFQYCVYLNDKYFLDGAIRAGMGGLHGRSWASSIAPGVHVRSLGRYGICRVPRPGGSSIRSGTSSRCGTWRHRRLCRRSRAPTTLCRLRAERVRHSFGEGKA